MSEIRESIDLNVPRRKASMHKNKKFAPNLIRKLITKKKSLWNKIKKNPNKTLKSKYNYTAKAIKVAIKQHNERTLSKKRNLKKIYSHINNTLGRETNIKIKFTNRPMDKSNFRRQGKQWKICTIFSFNFHTWRWPNPQIRWLSIKLKINRHSI